MSKWYHTAKKITGALVVLSVCASNFAQAEDQVNISDLQNQLKRARTEQGTAAEPSSAELEKLRKSLLEAEDQILDEMAEKKPDTASVPAPAVDSSSAAASAASSEVIVVKGEDRITVKPQAVPAPRVESPKVAVSNTAAQAVEATQETAAVAQAKPVPAKTAPQVSASFDQAVAALEGLRQTNSTLEVRANKAQSRASDLERQLAETRNRLIVAETEVERLSQILESRNKATLARYDATKPMPQAGVTDVPAANIPVIKPVPTQDRQMVVEPMHPVTLVSQTNREQTANDDLPIATVISD